jgi:hypothetical protein
VKRKVFSFQDEIVELFQLLTSEKWNEAINCAKDTFVTSKNILEDIQIFTTRQVRLSFWRSRRFLREHQSVSYVRMLPCRMLNVKRKPMNFWRKVRLRLKQFERN